MALLSCGQILNFQLFSHGENKILGSACRRYHPIGNGLFQFRFSCTCLLRGREVFFQSGGTADSYSTADPDKLPLPCVQNLFILEIENLLADFHDSPLFLL